MSCSSSCVCSKNRNPLTETADGVVEVVSVTNPMLTLEEAKDELGIVDTGVAEIDAVTDAKVTALTEAVTQDCERTVYKTYGAVVRTVKFATWPSVGVLFSLPPLVSVDSVQWYDVAGALQTMATQFYHVITPAYERGYLLWAEDFEPAELEEGNPLPIIITYTSGAATVPPVAKQAAKLALHVFHDNQLDPRELEYNQNAVWRLLDSERWGDYA